jgi:hypothetical protein
MTAPHVVHRGLIYITKMKNNFKNQTGVILLLTLFILSGILVVALAAADLVFAGLKMNRLTGYSNLAFFASEAGLERALWEARKDSYDLPGEAQTNIFENLDLGNNSAYHVNYASSSSLITFTSVGNSSGVKRATEVSYGLSGAGIGACVTSCAGKVCGDDGCGGSCGSCAANQSCVAGACVDNPITSPTNLALSHTANNKGFTVSWIAGSNNGGVNGCKLQFYNGSTWTDITSGANVNCDTTISGGSFTLNADGWKDSWGATQVRLLRKSDSTAMGTFPQTLACSYINGSDSATPTIDEDCNGYWDNINYYACRETYCAITGVKDVSYWGYAPYTGCGGTGYTGYIIYGCYEYADLSCYQGAGGTICNATYGSSPCDWQIHPLGSCCWLYADRYIDPCYYKYF